MKTALLLMAHGSNEAEANDDLHHLAAEMRQRGGFDMVEASFLELARPSIAEAVGRCVQQRATCVVMVPYFLSAGVHFCRDLKAIRQHMANSFPTVEFRLAQPLGRHSLLLEVVAQRAKEALSADTPPISGGLGGSSR